MRLWPKRHTGAHPADHLDSDETEVHRLDEGVSMDAGADAPAPERPVDDRAARAAQMAAKMAADLDAKHGSPSLRPAPEPTFEGDAGEAADQAQGGWDHLNDPAAAPQETASPVFVVDGSGQTEAVSFPLPSADDPERFPVGDAAQTPGSEFEELFAPAGTEVPEMPIGMPLADPFGDEQPTGEFATPEGEHLAAGADPLDLDLIGDGVPFEDPLGALGADDDPLGLGAADDDPLATPGPAERADIPTGPQNELTDEEIAHIIGPDPQTVPFAPIDAAPEPTPEPAPPPAPEPAVAPEPEPIPAPEPAPAAGRDPVVPASVQERVSAAGIAQLADQMVASVVTIQGALVQEREKLEIARAALPEQVREAVAAQMAERAGQMDAHLAAIAAGAQRAQEITQLHERAGAHMAHIDADVARMRAALDGAGEQAQEFSRLASQAQSLIDTLDAIRGTVASDVRVMSAQMAAAREQLRRIGAVADWAADAPEAIAAHVLEGSDQVRELDRMRTELIGAGERLHATIADAEARVATLESDAAEAMGAAGSLVEDLRAGADAANERINQIGVRAAEDASELRDAFAASTDQVMGQMRDDANATRAAADQARAGALAISGGLEDLVARTVAAQLRAAGITPATAASAPEPAPAAPTPAGASDEWEQLKARTQALLPRISAGMVNAENPGVLAGALAQLRAATTRDQYRAALENLERLFPHT